MIPFSSMTLIDIGKLLLARRDAEEGGKNRLNRYFDLDDKGIDSASCFKSARPKYQFYSNLKALRVIF